MKRAFCRTRKSREKFFHQFGIELSDFFCRDIQTVIQLRSAGEINGGFFGTLGQMIQMYEAQGADFSECETAEDKLAVIEAFEDALNASSNEVTAEERIAAALEYQVMASLPDEE
jgi:hypothetical protein